MEPYDDSVPAMLRGAGVSSHLITDHQHYFEFGGCTYHTQYDSWQFHRGQEGDPFIGQVRPAAVNPKAHGRNSAEGPMHENDRINRPFLRREEDQPQSKTFAAGIDFIDRNQAEDRWFLQIETFDPHEPFFTQRHYKDLYAEHYEEWRAGADKVWDWPPYDRVKESPEYIEHMAYQYAALVSMCDAKLGDVMDAMDRHGMWEDTMLVVWTDHGFLLGEHDWWAKMKMPWYEEMAHTPFFVWDPRCGKRGERRGSLVQPSLDLGPTLLELFGVDPTADMLGKPLAATIADDTPVREAAMFGQHGGQVNVTDGEYVYMRSPSTKDNGPLYEYTLMPTHMRSMFKPDEIAGHTELHEGFDFTKNCPVLKIDARGSTWADLKDEQLQTTLWNVADDPKQRTAVQNAAAEERMVGHLKRLMQECDAPPEQYERLGLL